MSRSLRARFSEGKIGKFIPYHFVNSYGWCIYVYILLMEEILHHLGCIKPCK